MSSVPARRSYGEWNADCSMKRKWLGRDFYQKSFSNPFRKIERNRHVETRARVARGLFALSLAGWIYFLFFSPIFQINNVTINRLKDIDEASVQNLVSKEIESRRFFIIPEKNIFIFNLDKFTNEFNAHYFVQNMQVKKILPDTLAILIQEKKPVAMVLYNDKDLLLDSEANIFRIITHDTLTSSTQLAARAFIMHQASTTIPFLELQDAVPQEIRKKALTPSILNAILTIKASLANRMNLNVNYISFKEGIISKITAHIIGGIDIYFEPNEIAIELDKLATFLESKKSGRDQNKIQYIDLRFGDKVYIK